MADSTACRAGPGGSVMQFVFDPLSCISPAGRPPPETGTVVAGTVVAGTVVAGTVVGGTVVGGTVVAVVEPGLLVPVAEVGIVVIDPGGVGVLGVAARSDLGRTVPTASAPTPTHSPARTTRVNRRLVVRLCLGRVIRPPGPIDVTLPNNSRLLSRERHDSSRTNSQLLRLQEHLSTGLRPHSSRTPRSRSPAARLVLTGLPTPVRWPRRAPRRSARRHGRGGISPRDRTRLIVGMRGRHHGRTAGERLERCDPEAFAKRREDEHLRRLHESEHLGVLGDVRAEPYKTL